MNGAAAAAPAGPRLWLFALLAGATAFAISCLLLPPATAAHSLGREFAAMADDPFGAHGPFPHRVLGPLVAWALGLGSERYWLFAHGTAVLLLAVVAGIARRRGCSPLGALLLAATVAVTGAVEFYKVHVGYPEPLAFALLLLAAASVQRPLAFWVFAALGLLNHEGALFLWPWLLWQRVHAEGARARDLGLGVAVVAGYLAVRAWLLARATQPVHDTGVYTSAELPVTLATWAMTAMGIGIWFGTTPLLLAWHAAARGWRAAGMPVLLVVAAVFAMATVATDLPRFIGYLSLPLTFAGVALLQQRGAARWFVTFAIATALAIVLQREVVRVLQEGIVRHAGAAVWQVAFVRDLWWLFAAYGLAFVAMIAVGTWLGRRSRARTGADAIEPPSA